MRSMTAVFQASLLILFAAFAISRAADAPPSEDAISNQYNTSIQPITEQIDDLRQKLDNSNMSMDDASKIIDQQSALRSKANDLWNSTEAKIDESFSYARKSINTYNDDNQRLEFERDVVGSKVDLLNNIVKNPTRDEFEKNKEQMSNDWEQNYGSRLKPFGEEFAKQKEEIFKNLKDQYGIDLKAEGYSRIGTSNPYTGEVYYQYYSKDGKKALWAQWQDDANGLKKAQDWVETVRRRRLEEQSALEKKAAALKDLDNGFVSSRGAVGQKLNTLENGVKLINFGGSWSGGDSLGRNIQLRLNNDGTMTYNDSQEGSLNGSWRQAGKTIYMNGRGGTATITWQSTILDDYRLQLNGSSTSGLTWTDYLKR